MFYLVEKLVPPAGVSDDVLTFSRLYRLIAQIFSHIFMLGLRIPTCNSLFRYMLVHIQMQAIRF